MTTSVPAAGDGAETGTGTQSTGQTVAWHLMAALGAFGLGTFAAMSGEPVAWLVAALVVGAIYRRALVTGYLGLIAAGFSFGALQLGLVPSPQGEAFLIPNYSPGAQSVFVAIAVAIAAPIGLYVGRRFAPGGLLAVLLAAAAAVGGGAAVVATAGTWATMAATPAKASFAFVLPAGWNVLGPLGGNDYREPAYGLDFTAVFGDPVRPEAGRPATAPILGVSIVRAHVAPEVCLSALNPWPGSVSPLFNATIVDSGMITLPAGIAAHVVRAPAPDGTRQDAYALSRVRHLGLVVEPLCYVVAVTTPPGSAIGPADVEAIVGSLRFR